MPWIVIPDVRFKNEVQAVKDWGGKAVQIIRPDNDPVSAAHATHASETELDGYSGWDYTIVNDRGLVDLLVSIRKTYTRMYEYEEN